jgi:hypothetical protein
MSEWDLIGDLGIAIFGLETNYSPSVIALISGIE